MDFLDIVDFITNIDPSERMEYLDVKPLHSCVNQSKFYQIGHPVIIQDKFQDLHNYFGLVRCKVLAPSKVYHSVLPVQFKGELFFPLCK